MNKIISVVTCSVFLLLFFGCSKSDDSESDKITENKALLIGGWYVVNEYAYDSDNHVVSERSMKASEDCPYDELTFVPNGTANYLAYLVLEKPEVEKVECEENLVPNAYTWGLPDGRRLKVSNGESTDDYVFMVLNQQNMRLSRGLTPSEVIQGGYDKSVVRIEIEYNRILSNN
ncbi:hypothetical protein [Myroides indicus]|uniref:Lipocalin-like protein n=1 Tax=Myroides indicus TaxID=1323422 RepID=A0A4R7F038_9FLAO|nr:hypothetical protein [Myroides indicus]TDS55925.1 hypothetical protein C8P70_12146 [Myroides indicus]